MEKIKEVEKTQNVISKNEKFNSLIQITCFNSNPY